MIWRGKRADTGEAVQIMTENGRIAGIIPLAPLPEYSQLPLVSAGWFDLQVNGFGGYDLNKENVSEEDVAGTVKALYKKGTAVFLPTIITGSMERMKKGLSAIAKYRNQSRAKQASIPGIHLEGPFLSSEDGCRGAHPREHTCNPDWNKFEQLQEAAQGLIKMVTLAPERKGAQKFIEKLVANGVVVAIGHTMASEEDLDMAVAAGATICTHLGNGSQPMLPRHPNYIWNQLADDRLWAAFIPDGHHLSPKVLQVMLRAKGKRSILVSDTTQFGGMEPGVYDSLIGGRVRLTDTGRLHTLENPQILAGSAASFEEGIATVLNYTDWNLAETIEAMTTRPYEVMGLGNESGALQMGMVANLTLFHLDKQNRPVIEETVVNGETVFKAGLSEI